MAALPYISPSQMEEYRRVLTLFAKKATALDCIRSHYLPDHSGVCDLTKAKDQDELFVLQNRAGATMKVSANAMQIVANLVDVHGADAWYSHLREQRKIYRERSAEEAKKRDEERKASSRTVLLRKKSPNTPIKDKNS